MKRQSFQTKRRPTGGGLFVFHSKTRRRKKQRVAASAHADLGSEVPNLGIARALFVILILHVAAIAAIFIHNRVTNEDLASAANGTPATAAAMQGGEKLPVIQSGEDFYFVATGDTYNEIARLKGVDVDALRDLNNNVKLKAGRILRIPAGGATAPESQVASTPEPDPAPSAPAVVPVTPVPAPAPATLVKPNPDLGNVARAIIVKRQDPGPAVRVGIESSDTPEDATAPPVVQAAVPVIESGGTYLVKSGDTAWGISQRYKISSASLLEANGITDARKLRAGMKLKIPGQ